MLKFSPCKADIFYAVWQYIQRLTKYRCAKAIYSLSFTVQ